MPTYLNSTNDVIKVKFRSDNGLDTYIEILPGKSHATEKILINDNLTKTSDAPFYNPLQNDVHVVTSTGVGDDQTVGINLWTKSISILNQSAALVNVFLCSKSNTPALKSYPYTERIVEVAGNVNQLILEFPSAATVYVEERK